MRRLVYSLQNGVFNLGLEEVITRCFIVWANTQCYDVKIPGFMAVMYDVVFS